jgi:predicted aspartyl protease
MNKQIRAMNTQEEEENGENKSKEETSETEQEEEAEKQNCETAQLSMHAVQGTSSKVNTFVLQVCIGKLKATALVDTGSTGTFIDSKFAICNNIPLSSASKLVVLAANGQEMLSTSQCKDCSYSIQGKDFTTDFRVISLKGYDMIMGTDWMQVHSQVEFDYRSPTRGLSIKYYGQEKMMLRDTTVQ